MLMYLQEDFELNQSIFMNLEKVNNFLIEFIEGKIQLYPQ